MPFNKTTQAHKAQRANLQKQGDEASAFTPSRMGLKSHRALEANQHQTHAQSTQR